MNSYRTLSVLVENNAGVLSRISGLFSRRGFNIKSLAVGETENAAESRMTIIVECGDGELDQVVAQLAKQVCVKKVVVLEQNRALNRELVLIKVSTSSQSRSQIIEIANIFRARVIDVDLQSITLEMTGETSKTEALLELLREFGVLESARTGSIALERGSVTIYGENP